MKHLQCSQYCSRVREYGCESKANKQKRFYCYILSTVQDSEKDRLVKLMWKENLYIENDTLEKDRIRIWVPGPYSILWSISSVTLTKSFNLSYKVIF